MTLTAHPDPGSAFMGWSGDCAGTGTRSIAMTADHSVTSEFAPAP